MCGVCVHLCVSCRVEFCRVEAAARNMWEEGVSVGADGSVGTSGGSGQGVVVEEEEEEEEMSEEQQEHKKKFHEWRKNHYNEFRAMQRARALMKQVCVLCVCEREREGERVCVSRVLLAAVIAAG